MSSEDFNRNMEIVAAHLASITVKQELLQETQARAEARLDRSEVRLDRVERVLGAAIRLGSRQMREIRERIDALIDAQERSRESLARTDAKLAESQARTDAKLAESRAQLVESQARTDEKLAESHARTDGKLTETDARLNRLADTVERYISERRNGNGGNGPAGSN